MAPTGAATTSAPRSGAAAGTVRTSIQYRMRSVWVLAFYLPLFVFPWIATCVLMFRPFGRPAYIDQDGNYTEKEARHTERLITAIGVLNLIAAVIAVPVVSSLLAHAAVRYSQRRAAGQKLSLAQLFGLANRRWAEFPTTWRSMEISPFLLLGFLLVFITVIQPPLQSLLVRYEPISIITCNDTYMGNLNDLRSSECGGYYSRKQTLLGHDPEPGDLETCPQDLVIQKLAHKISDVSSLETQRYLWPEEISDMYFMGSPTLSTFSWYRTNANDSYYAAALPNGTTTGVLRYHALRQNSTAKCEKVPQSNFPSTCPGDAPFTTAFSHPDLDVRVCAPGDTHKHPWTLSRNRQTISEELWIDFAPKAGYEDKNYTLHCTAASIRGYFELGNYHNGNQPGPLLETWPGPDEMAADFNDAEAGSVSRRQIPTEMAAKRTDSIDMINWDTPPRLYDSPYDRYYQGQPPTPGPLMTAAMALFGNSSFLFPAKNATESNFREALRTACRSNIPFYLSYSYYNGGWTGAGIHSCELANEDNNWRGDSWGDEYFENRLVSLIQGIFDLFRKPDQAKSLLQMSMFFANEVLLTTTAAEGAYRNSREIYTSPGYQITKPVKSIPAIVVISTLLVLQLVGLLWLAVYNTTVPTWTSTLDALAMAKIGRELHKDEVYLSPLGVHDTRDAKKLGAANGIVGAVEEAADRDDISEMTLGREAEQEEIRPGLSMGAPGVITRDMRYRKPKKSKTGGSAV